MTSFSKRLIDWQKRLGRRNLPWQNSSDPYHVWLSEIMLQQTQVATVIPYYLRFLKRFPKLDVLAAASVEEVMAYWSGLGYYARARNLYACAKMLAAHHASCFPREPEKIAALPGIGRSTANAIAVFCFDARVPILDGNVKRLLCRHAGIEGWPGTPAIENELWHRAALLLPKTEVATYIQAQMDLGATICTRSRPVCSACPVTGDCLARCTGRTQQLPTARPRKALPAREITVLILSVHDRVLLLPRPPIGIWGGLLSLPEVPEGSSAEAETQRLGYKLLGTQSLAPTVHAFTHFRLTMYPLRCKVQPLQKIEIAVEPTGTRWLLAQELAQAPLPAPIRKLLAAAIPDYWMITCQT
jgi:A/G-specific adenine glycosylase